MKKKIIISTVIVYIAGSLLSPPDALTSHIYGIESALLCCILLLILNRREFVKSSPNSMHTLVCVLVCMVSFLSVYWINTGAYLNLYPSSSGWTSSSSGGSFNFGNLRAMYSFGPDSECVVFSVDDPNVTKQGANNNWKLTFLDNSSVEFNIIKNETVWVDKKHRVTFLGPILNKEDVLLLEKFPRDEELKISSPDELLEIVNKLKTENTASVRSF